MRCFSQRRCYGSTRRGGSCGRGKPVSTEVRVTLRVPGQGDCLKTRRDGTIIDRHHRIQILHTREVEADGLPREIILRDHLERRFVTMPTGLHWADGPWPGTVLIHRRRGDGQSRLVAACLLVTKGWEPSPAIRHLSSEGKIPIPETAPRRPRIAHFAALVAETK